MDREKTNSDDFPLTAHEICMKNAQYSHFQNLPWFPVSLQWCFTSHTLKSNWPHRVVSVCMETQHPGEWTLGEQEMERTKQSDHVPFTAHVWKTHVPRFLVRSHWRFTSHAWKSNWSHNVVGVCTETPNPGERMACEWKEDVSSEICCMQLRPKAIKGSKALAEGTLVCLSDPSAISFLCHCKKTQYKYTAPIQISVMRLSGSNVLVWAATVVHPWGKG